MKKTIITSLLITLLALQFSPYAYSQKLNVEEDKILTAAESVFKAMKTKDFSKTWSLLTNASKNTIIDDVLKEESKRGVQYPREVIDKDFQTGGSLAKAYWSSYLTVFNPDTILEQSKWEMGKVEKERAEIIIKYHKSDRPAQLKMVKENGAWKVGLEETFRSSRR